MIFNYWIAFGEHRLTCNLKDGKPFFASDNEKTRCNRLQRVFNNGRSGGIRTRDPLLPKQMRYQAALRSDKQ